MKIHIAGRLAFPQLFKPEQYQSQGEAMYKATILIPKTAADPAVTILHPPAGAGLPITREPSTIGKVIDLVGKAKWPKDWAVVKKGALAKDKNCWHDGDNKSQWAGFEGCWYVSASASSDKRPTVVGRRGEPLTAADGIIYGGCYVIASMEVWAQDNGFGKQVNAQILGVQFVRDGDSFGGGSAPARPDEFEQIDDGADADEFSEVDDLG
jgi:hypothetical protein